MRDVAPIQGRAGLDARGIILAIDLAGARMLGRSHKYLIGSPLYCYLAEGEQPKFRAHLNDCHRQGSASMALTLITGAGVRAAVRIDSTRQEPDSSDGVQYLIAIAGHCENPAAAYAREAGAARFQDLVDELPHIIWECRADGANVFHNRTWHRYTGAAPGHSFGLDWLEFYHPDDRLDLLEAWNSSVESGGSRPYDGEARIRRHDGVYRWFRIAGTPLRDGEGRTVRWVGSCTDIDDQKQIETALVKAHTEAVEERNRLSAVMEALPIGIAMIDAAGGNLRTNPEFERVWGSPRPPARTVDDYAAYRACWIDTGKPVRPEERASARAIQRGETVVGQKMEIQRFDGSRAFVLNSGVPIRNAEGRITGCVVAIQDITQQQQAENELHQRRKDLEFRVQERTAELRQMMERVQCERQRFKDVLDQLPAYLVLLSPDHRVVFANRFFEERFGKSPGLRCFEYLFDRSEPCENCQTFPALKSHTPHHWEWTGPDGRSYDIYDTAFTDTDGSLLTMKVGLDISERKQAEAALRDLNENLERRVTERAAEVCASEARLAGIVNSAMDAILSVDEQLRICLFNPAAETTFGLNAAEAIGLPLARFIPEASRQIRENRLRNLAETDISTGRHGSLGELTGRRARGEEFPIEASVSQIFLAGKPLFTLVLRDIGERKKAEANLRKSRAQLKTFIHYAPASIAMFDLNMNFLAVSGRWLLDYGRGHADLTGKNHYEVYPDLPAEWKRVHRQALAGDSISNDEELWIQADGNRLWLRWAVQPWTDEDGAIGGIVISVDDITEQRQTQAALRNSQKDLDRAQEVGQMGWWRLDTRRNILRWSDENHRIFGVPQGTPLNYEDFLNRIHPADREYVDLRWQAALSGDPYDIEHRIRVAGKVKWVREKAYLEFDADGELLGGFGITQDISQRKQTDETVRQLAQFPEENPSPVLRIGIDGLLQYANAPAQHWLATLGWADDGPLPAEIRALVSDTCASRRVHECEIGSVSSTYWLSTVQPDGEDYINVYGKDITERKNAERALYEADRRKDEFLAMLAHELRNPLAPVRNAVELLQRRDALNEAQIATCHAIIARQIEYLIRLVDDLLDVSRISRGIIDLQKDALAVADIVLRAVETSRPLIESRRQELSLELPAEPLNVEGDLIRLTQVVANLLNNAAKYTDVGGLIRLNVGSANGQVSIHVRDNGRGIDPAALPRVFELFYQADQTLDRSGGGLGIGLFLAGELVASHGGSIEAHSAGLGRGCEFVVHLPRLPDPPVQEPVDTPTPPACRDKLLVLVVDDNSDAAETLAMWLRSIGHDAITAFNGETALAMTLAEPPHIVLLDIGLPGIDGLGVARALRQRRELSDSWLIAVTGYGQAHDREKTQAAGFDHHLVKPVDFNVLQSLLDEYGALRA